MHNNEEGCSSDTEELYDALKTAQNRKQRQAGGWQTIGTFGSYTFQRNSEKGFRQPTPIQRKAIPLIIDGKDIVAMSRTGSGKTAAFVVPILQKLRHRDMKGIRGLIIEPTRELAMQTFTVVKELGRFTGLHCAVLVGGDRIEEQFQAVHEKPDIVIATPGRLLHVIMEMDFRLSAVQIVVFDEADRLFEMGFAEQLHEILKRLPENRQTLLFSATLPKSIIAFSKAGLSDPVLGIYISSFLRICLGILHLAREVVAGNEQTVVFCATMKHVEYLAAIAEKAGIDCVVLYSQLDSVARNINIQKFRRKECSLLIVTDIAARGVDIPLLDVAINYHFPPKPKLFVHRVGRVARAGRFGKAISLFGADEVPYVDELLKKSENAMQKYKKTRPQPSAESVRRAKTEMKEALIKASVHPSLQQQTPEETIRQSLLRDLHNFKSSATIFEIQSGSKTLSAAVMKEKRKAHQNYIHSKTDLDKCQNFNQLELTNPTCEANEDVLATYESAEANAERGLAVDHDFNALAKESAIEILADDDIGWDRKLKKFVGDTGDNSKKKMRAEDGTYIPATYKSGRYERWQKKQKLEYQNNEDDEESTDARVKQHDFRKRNGNRKGRRRNNTGNKEKEHHVLN
ncbi:ATP-dependent RNA helicase DDX54 [Dirofilaria immitis]|nr:ATP-dependent RNA helicase DDX54 [Dirofilaria immitis]